MTLKARREQSARAVETHVSWVFFTSEHVYKVKKPVHFGFVDFSTPAARRRACADEVRLNRRLCPDVYEGVAHLAGPHGEDEPVVVMRRLPDDRRLSVLARERDPRAEVEVDRIAKVLARFHQSAERSAEIDADAGPAAVRRLWRDNLDELERDAGDTLDTGILGEVAAAAEHFVATRAGLLEARVAAGHACDGHGDLLADDIFCLDDGPRILDCLEFDGRLRAADVVADVAFLAMDLERLGRPDLGWQLMDSYRRASGDDWPAALEEHWIAYRALVRCKVATLRAGQDGSDVTAEEARWLLESARRHLRRASIRMVIIGGLPGTGKSTVAAELARRHGWPLIRSDVLRKQLAGLDPLVHSDAPFGTGLYEADRTAAVYAELLAMAGDVLHAGGSVVLDASWLQRCWRLAAAEMAQGNGAELVELRCEAPAGVAADRLRRRHQAGTDASDATPAVAIRLAASADPWPEAVVLDATSSPDATIAQAEDVLVSPGPGHRSPHRS